MTNILVFCAGVESDPDSGFEIQFEPVQIEELNGAVTVNDGFTIATQDRATANLFEAGFYYNLTPAQAPDPTIPTPPPVTPVVCSEAEVPAVHPAKSSLNPPSGSAPGGDVSANPPSISPVSTPEVASPTTEENLPATASTDNAGDSGTANPNTSS